MLLCLFSLSAFTSCGPKSKWEQVSRYSIRCLSNESEKSMIFISSPSDGHRVGATIEAMSIIIDDYQKPLPDIIKLEVIFGEDGISPKQQTFQVVNFKHFSPEDNSIDGFYGGVDEMGALVITMTNSRLGSEMLSHQFDKNDCIITSSSFSHSYTFHIKGLGETLIGVSSRNAGW